MKVIVVRHGIAEEAGKGSDSERRLTAEGVAKMRQAAEGLRGLVGRSATVYSSSLVRARQTAEILAAVIGLSKVKEMEGLEPEADPQRTAEEIAGWHRDEVIIVGHEPHLGALVSTLVGGGEIVLKKGGAALVELDDDKGVMRWLLTAKQLRALRWAE